MTIRFIPWSLWYRVTFTFLISFGPHRRPGCLFKLSVLPMVGVNDHHCQYLYTRLTRQKCLGLKVPQHALLDGEARSEGQRDGEARPKGQRDGEARPKGQRDGATVLQAMGPHLCGTVLHTDMRWRGLTIKFPHPHHLLSRHLVAS